MKLFQYFTQTNPKITYGLRKPNAMPNKSLHIRWNSQLSRYSSRYSCPRRHQNYNISINIKKCKWLFHWYMFENRGMPTFVLGLLKGNCFTWKTENTANKLRQGIQRKKSVRSKFNHQPITKASNPIKCLRNY